MVFDPRIAIWPERYRPAKVSEMVGDFKEKILRYLKDPQTVPHFLLYSKTPGTGKTTLAKAIFNELGCDYLILNSSDDRRMEVVRDKIKEFAITKTSKEGLKRGILCDEFDGMLKASQEALRNMMETYSSNCFFVLTCNNLNRVIEPIQSRCILVEFSAPNKNEIYKYLEMICTKEKLDYTEDGIKELINLNYPSIRNCVKSLQDLYTEGKQIIKENVKPNTQLYDDMWKKLQEKKWMDIKQLVMEATIDPRELNKHFWQKAILSEEPNLKIIQLCCRNERDFAYGSDASVIFVSSLLEMIK